jgi:hypothetical protein
MSRIHRLLRASLLPALALLGLALFAGGVVGWWSFYRELFVEELAAIEALAGKDGVVDYRRQGEASARVYDAAKPKREPVRWSVPFAGRVEHVYMRQSGHPYASPPIEVRNCVLRLPGLAAYDGPNYSIGIASAFPCHDADELPLGRRLPPLPPKRLDPKALTAPMPEGEPVDDDERQAIAGRIAATWQAGEEAAPRLRYSLKQTTPSRYSSASAGWRLTLEEGDRRFDSSATATSGSYALFPAEIEFDDGRTYYSLLDDSGGWRLYEFRPRAVLPLRPNDEWSHAEARPHDAGSPYTIAIMYGGDDAVALLGLRGDEIAVVARIDDERYRIETRPWPDPEILGRTLTLTAIVNRKFDWGIERYLVEEARDGEPDVERFAGAHRLEEVAGRTVVVESLTADTFFSGENDDSFDLGTQPPSYSRTFCATEFDPDYSEALFDPRSYERDLPEVRQIPIFRTYRVLTLLGGLCLASATIGWFIGGRMRPSRAAIGSDSTKRRGRSLQFGFATLFAVALLVISLAGWVKRHLDEAHEQIEILTPLSAEGARIEVERTAPGFPWMFLSTDALPLGAPIESVRASEPPPAEAVDRLLRVSPAIAYVCETPERSERPDERPDAENFERHLAALRKPEAPVGDADWPAEPLDPFENRDVVLPALTGLERQADPLDAFPHGPRYEEPSKTSVIDEAIQAWRQAGAARVERFVVLEETHWDNDSDFRMTIRDGASFRNAESEQGVDWIECQDERFRRRFAWDDDAWRLVLRRPIADDEEEPAAVTLPSAKENGARLLASSGIDAATAPASPYGRPVSAAGLPRAPYCLPPCLAGWTPPLNEALCRIEPGDVVAVESIDVDRVRFDLLYPYPKSDEAPLSDEATPDLPWVVDWSIVVRTDLDWAVERCEYVDEFIRDVPVTQEVKSSSIRGGINFGTRTDIVATGAVRPARRRREVKIVNEFHADESAPAYVGSLFDCKELEEGAFAGGISGRVFYALDRSPRFAGAVFDRATVDSPDPPLPERKPGLPWYLVTGPLACTALVVLGVRRTVFRRGEAGKAAA